MTFDKFTIKAQEAVQEAVNTAQQAGQQAIEPVHLLQGILVKSRDVTNFIFQSPTTLTKCWSVPSQTRRKWVTSSSAWSLSS